jgi:glucosyl-3-phosphoglycerate synthase
VSDFHQNGIITTIHNLTRRGNDELDPELLAFQERRPMCLVLPSLFSELESPALAGIVKELAEVPYLSEIIIGLDRADEDQYRHALQYFRRLPQRHRVLWHDGPRLLDLDQSLRFRDLAPKQPGKGRNVWFCFGYALASGRSRVVALHDCDIVTYRREMLGRLLYPVANPSFSYKYCKGYYARFAKGQMNGRVCRLLVPPLIRALRTTCGRTEFLDYLDSFRYPLAGEFALQADVLEDLRIPSDWGLEMGVLSEVRRNFAPRRICQVDIADSYDHKHQHLSEADPAAGLSRMSTDIAKALFRKLATQGNVFSQETFRTVKATYYRLALDFSESYHDDAVVNGLKYDRHREEAAIEVFAEAIMRAGSEFLNKPMEAPFMPSWRRVMSALPDVRMRLLQAVDADMAEYS